MTTEEKLAAVGNAVKEPRKAKGSEKLPEPETPGAQATTEELAEAGEAEQSEAQVDLEVESAPSKTEKTEHKATKHAASPTKEHPGSRAATKSIGKLMRFRRKRATRR